MKKLIAVLVMVVAVGLVAGQVTTKDGKHGVWTKNGKPVMIKNIKPAK
jgi:Flp pilus assembly pilin Flp